MRKVDDGEEKKKKKRKKKREKIMTFIVATNLVASRTPGTPHARIGCLNEKSEQSEIT